MSSLFAFIHHVAAFTLVSALAIELVLVKGDLSLRNARRLLLTDMISGVSAGVVLIVGFLRVVYFEKGSSYYFHSAPFIAKLSLFALIALISLYPTLEFLSWRAPLKQGVAPAPDPAKLRAIGSIIHWELIGVVLLILCAAPMARGVGYFGA
jgi:putative membrane protein